MRFLNISGQRFGRLRAVSLARKNPTVWLCVCDCGNECKPHLSGLRSGRTQSCGCLQRERTGNAARTHGKSWKIPEYNIWVCIRTRCNNPRVAAYERYGGRGIKVCERWNRFENFLADMGSRPSPAHSIERKDNDGDYTPDNCVWATDMVQASNKRNNRWIEKDGIKLTVAQWERRLGFRKGIIQCRIFNGWSNERALTPKLLKTYK